MPSYEQTMNMFKEQCQTLIAAIDAVKGKSSEDETRYICPHLAVQYIDSYRLKRCQFVYINIHFLCVQACITVY